MLLFLVYRNESDIIKRRKHGAPCTYDDFCLSACGGTVRIYTFTV